jgi:WD40 repeat protein
MQMFDSKRSTIALSASCGRWLLFVAFAYWVATFCAHAQSQVPTNSGTAVGAAAAPILRIDPGAHTALPRALAYDAKNERIYSSSDDKTVRVWQVPSGKLLTTLRVPILDGPEGQLYAVALSPDGRWLVAGGWTGWDWERRASIYVFDTQTEQIVRRLPVASWTITSLRFSPDGQHIAVGMHGQGGLIIVHRESGKIIASDTAYQNKVMDMEFDRFGRLHTVGLDGFMRLYQQDFKLLARRAMKAGKDPVALRASPNGEQVVIGFADVAAVEVVNARDLSTVADIRLPAGKQKDLVAVGWSSDGRHLYAGGESSQQRAEVYRWELPINSSNGVRSAIANMPQAQQFSISAPRINEFWPLSQGRMAFTTDAPSIGWIEATGQIQQTIQSAQLDFSQAGHSLMLSADASRVQLAISGRMLTYTVPEAKLNWQANNSPSAGLNKPVQQAAGWAVRISQDQRSLTINGQVVALEEYEKVRSYAIAVSKNSVSIGTEWALRQYDVRGQLQWIARVSAPVWGVNNSADGKTTVALLGDGTIRWFSIQTGKQLLSLFIHRNSTDWIAWLPNGFYASSLYGDRHIGWHINRGLEISPDFIYAVQLERVLYRPDRVKSALGTLTAEAAASDLTAEQLNQIAPPRVRVKLQGIDVERNMARLIVEAERTGPAMQDVAVYVNDIPVTASKDRALRSSENRLLKREFEVPLTQRVNDIRVEAFTGQSMGLARIQAELPETALLQKERGDLYVLAIGASQFDKLPQNNWLAYAAKDADILAQTLQVLPSTSFAKRHVQVVSDNTKDKPTRGNILRALEFLKNARAQDTVVLFLASHGLSDARGNYYFVPSDAQAQDLKGLQAVDQPQSLLSWQVFFDVLRQVAGQRIMVVDTCQAKGIAGRFDPNSLIKRSASSQFALMLASGENEESQEYDPAGHGLFTFGLLTSLQEAQKKRNQALSLKEWFAASALLVQRFRDRSLGPQTPQLLAPGVLENANVLAVF